MKKTYIKPEALALGIEMEGVIALSSGDTIPVDPIQGGNGQMSNDKDWNGGNSIWANMREDEE